MKVGDEVYYDNLPGVGIVTNVVGDIAHVNWDFGTSSMTSKKMLRLKNSKEEPKGHPNAAILMEIAKEAAINKEYWKEFEFEDDHIGWTGAWGEWELFRVIIGTDCKVRRSPRTIRIGKYDVPEPIMIRKSSNGIITIGFRSEDATEIAYKALQELLGAKQ